jgi:hypothetical protein
MVMDNSVVVFFFLTAVKYLSSAEASVGCGYD